MKIFNFNKQVNVKDQMNIRFDTMYNIYVTSYHDKKKLSYF